MFEMPAPHPFQEGFEVRSPSPGFAAQRLGIDAALVFEGATACASTGMTGSRSAARAWAGLIRSYLGVILSLLRWLVGQGLRPAKHRPQTSATRHSKRKATSI